MAYQSLSLLVRPKACMKPIVHVAACLSSSSERQSVDPDAFIGLSLTPGTRPASCVAIRTPPSVKKGPPPGVFI